MFMSASDAAAISEVSEPAVKNQPKNKSSACSKRSKSPVYRVRGARGRKRNDPEIVHDGRCLRDRSPIQISINHYRVNDLGRSEYRTRNTRGDNTLPHSSTRPYNPVAVERKDFAYFMPMKNTILKICLFLNRFRTQVKAESQCVTVILSRNKVTDALAEHFAFNHRDAFH